MKKRVSSKSEYMAELERDCALRFDAVTTSAMVMEVDAHLSESIQARLELGEPPETAEFHAVAAFANVNQFIERMEKVHAPKLKGDKWLFAFGLPIALVNIVVLTFQTFAANPMGGRIALGTLAILSICGFVRSCMFKEFKSRTIKQLTLVALVSSLAVCPLLEANLNAYGNGEWLGIGPAWTVPYEIQEAQRMLDSIPPKRVHFADPVNRVHLQALIESSNRFLKSPLLERYPTNFATSLEMVFFSLGWLLIFHFIPTMLVQTLAFFSRKLRSVRGRFTA